MTSVTVNYNHNEQETILAASNLDVLLMTWNPRVHVRDRHPAMSLSALVVAL